MCVRNSRQRRAFLIIFKKTDAYRVRPLLGIAGRPHGPRALSAGRLSCAYKTRGNAAPARSSLCPLVARTGRPPLGSLVARTGRPPLGLKALQRQDTEELARKVLVI